MKVIVNLKESRVLLLFFLSILNLLVLVFFPIRSLANETITTNFTLGIQSSSGMEPFAVVKDSSENIISAGGFFGTVDFDPGHVTVGDTKTTAGSNDMFIVKHNSSGVVQWVKALGGTGGDSLLYMTIDSSDNIYVTGYLGSNSVDFDEDNVVSGDTHSRVGSRDIVVAKYSSAGVLQWVITPGGTSNSGTGEEGRDIMVDSNGNIYVAGSFNTTVDFDENNVISGDTKTAPTGTESFLAKYNNSGTLQWVKQIGATTAFNEEGNGVFVDNGGFVYTVGYFTGSMDFDRDNVVSGDTQSPTISGTDNMYIAKYNSAGVLQWVETPDSNDDSEAEKVQVDGSGNVYLVGAFKGSTIDFDDGAVTSGDTHTNTGNPQNEIFIVKYNSNGGFVWARTPNGTAGGTEKAYNLGIDTLGNVYVTGNFEYTVDFDENNITPGDTFTGSSLIDPFLLKLSPTGDFEWIEVPTGTGQEFAYGLYVIGVDNILFSGNYTSSVDFDTDNITAGDTLSFTSGTPGFIVEYYPIVASLGPEMRIVLRDSDLSGVSTDTEIWFDTIDIDANSRVIINFDVLHTGGSAITTTDITVTCDPNGLDPLSGTVMTNVTVISSENGYLELDTGADSCADYMVVDINGGGGNQLTNPVSSGNYSWSVVINNGNDEDIDGDGATLAYVQNENDVNITANVPPILDLELYEVGSNILLNGTGTNICALGVLSINTVSTCSYDIGTGTNNIAGVSITISSDGPLDDGAGNTIDACSGTNCNGLGSAGVSASEEEYGIYISELGGGEYTAAGSFGTQHQAIPTSETTFTTSSSTGSGTTTGSISQRLEVTHAASISTATNQGGYNQVVTFKAYTN